MSFVYLFSCWISVGYKSLLLKDLALIFKVIICFKIIVATDTDAGGALRVGVLFYAWTLTMIFLCLGSHKLDIQKFTVLLVHVVGSTPPSALCHSTPFAIRLVQDFLTEHTKVDVGKVTELSDRFRNLEVDSRLEIIFKGKLKWFAAPLHSVFTHQSEYRLVIFEAETRITTRYIPPGAEYQELEFERTDFLKYYIDNLDIRSELGSRRVSYTPHSASGKLGRLS